MAFVKERIPEADKDLFNSFDVYDYDNREEHTKWSPDSKWVVDREREIYFFYVSGGHHLEQHPYQQYDLEKSKTPQKKLKGNEKQEDNEFQSEKGHNKASLEAKATKRCKYKTRV